VLIVTQIKISSWSCGLL